MFKERPVAKRLVSEATDCKMVIRPLRMTLPADLDVLFSIIEVTPEAARTLCIDTIDQAKSGVWRKAREVRITASKAHAIAHGRTVNSRFQHFSKVLGDLPNLRYGVEMEPEARTSFENLINKKVTALGLAVKCGQQWLAASPDGCYLSDDAELTLLEIKCPSSCKDDIIDVKYIKDGKLQTNHPYYCQVQLQMYCCNAKSTSFYVYSSIDAIHLTIPFDREFC
jgi:putative phage-type endonuclease